MPEEQTQGEDILDVVRDFRFNSSSDRYNRDYQDWRRFSKSHYAFRFMKNKKERVYVEGTGFLNSGAAEATRTALRRVGKVIGIALLVYLLCDLGGSALLVWIFQRLGFHVSGSLFSTQMYGSQWGIVFVKMIDIFLRYALTALVLQCCFRLPFSVCASYRPTASSDVLQGSALALLVGTAVCVLSGLTGTSQLSQQLLYSYTNGKAVLVYVMYEITFASMLIEMLYRGMLLPVLRQFGDKFAVSIIVLIAFLQPNSLPYRIGEALLGLLCGYFMLRTGSLFCCYLIRIAYVLTTFGQLALDSNQVDRHLIHRIYVLVTLVALVSFVVMTLIRKQRKSKAYICNRCLYLSTQDKLAAFFSSTTMLPWLAVMILLGMLQIFQG